LAAAYSYNTLAFTDGSLSVTRWSLSGSNDDVAQSGCNLPQLTSSIKKILKKNPENLQKPEKSEKIRIIPPKNPKIFLRI